ncbi:MAG: VWA domain-containing protein [Akkermansiaceae bacterium]|nr:VWA domain-containing protein [Akkermansiaceae bacterium]NNM30947.1 VWA domain-containing protein [Akkermansiaceae bacterium]
MTNPLQHLAFAEPSWLWLLLLVPPVLFLANRRGAAASIGFSSTAILGSVGRRPSERPGALALLLLATILLAGIFALARPQWRNEFTARSASGIDIIIALDVSTSMSAQDFYPNDNPRQFAKRRIDAAKEVIEGFIMARPDDRIGLVAFSGRPYAVSPITLDHDWLTMNLRRLRFGELDEQGTAIGSAVAASATRLTKREAKSKIIVLVTDGSNNSGKLDPIEAARLAASLGIRIYTVAIGSEEGRVSRRYQSFPQQEFDPKTLQQIASLTSGEYFHARTTGALRNTFSSINELERSEAQSHTVVDARELYPYLLGITFLLSFISLGATGLNPPPMP